LVGLPVLGCWLLFLEAAEVPHIPSHERAGGPCSSILGVAVGGLFVTFFFFFFFWKEYLLILLCTNE